MFNVEQAIREVAGVYQAVTGKPLTPGRTDLPPEVDPVGHVESRYRQLRTLLEGQMQGAVPHAAVLAWSPPMDVYELERAIRFELDVPGVPREAVAVSVVGDCLVIRGERQAPRVHGVVRHQERRVGPFHKVVALPPRARRDGIEASIQGGVLAVVVPTDGAGAETAEITVEVK